MKVMKISPRADRLRHPLAALGLALPMLVALLLAPAVVEAKPFVGAGFQSYTSRFLAERDNTSRLLAERDNKGGKVTKAGRGAKKKKHLRRTRHRRRHVAPTAVLASTGSVIIGEHSDWPLSSFDDDGLPLDPTQIGAGPPDDIDGPVFGENDDVADTDEGDDGDVADDKGAQPGDVVTDRSDDEDQGSDVVTDVGDGNGAQPPQDEPTDEVNEPTGGPAPDFVELASDYVSDGAEPLAQGGGGDGDGPLVFDFAPTLPLDFGPFADNSPASSPADVGGTRPVPEPSSLALAALALLGAGHRARRARARRAK